MAEEEYDEELDDEVVDGDPESAEKGGSKKKLFLLIGVALLLVVGGAAGAYFTGLLQPITEMFAGGGEEIAEEAEPQVQGSDIIFYDLPELLVNLNTGQRKATFLKIRISLELDQQRDVPKLEQFMPRIIDNFQVYLRELRIEDLKGSAGMYRLREELLTRVTAAASPIKVNDILFKEMLIQ